MNNRKKLLVVCAIIALVILALAIIITFITQLSGFCIVLITLFIVLSGCLSVYIKEAPDDYTAFIKEKKRILKTYDSVIVEVETLPNIAGKNVIKVKTIDDLVDAQLELREPIYYKNDNDSCFFLLLHYNEACIYILRVNDSVISPTELSIKFMKPDKNQKKSNYENLLEDIENTVVYKLDELRSYKISPVRNEETFEIVDDTAIKKSIENTVKISRAEIEAEISKTEYLKNLKEKVAELENSKSNVNSNLLKEKEKEPGKEKQNVEEKVQKVKPKKRKVNSSSHAKRRTQQYNKNQQKK